MGFSRLYARKLLILVAAAGITVLPSFVYGLGLGAVKLNSSLSEILDAEIDLIAATPNDVGDLKVKLASSEAFLRAGIERTGLLTTLRFAVKRHDNGKYVIKITSRQAIREPFLNFLLEVNWKNGRMLREYTMLIDPPGRRVEQAQQSTIQAPQTMEVEAVQPTPEPSPFIDDVTPAVEEPVKAELAVPKVIEPVVAESILVPEPEPVIPDTIPEPEPVIPEPAVADEPVIVDDTKGVSGEVLNEHTQSGQVIEENNVAENELKMTATETFGEGELFPTIPLTEYDESKSIVYDDEPNEEPMAAAQSELMGGDAVPEENMQLSQPMEKGNLDYGITKKSDNLWTIASRMKSDDASVYQVMMALLKSNPNAFTDGNIHRLKVGQVLRIDNPGLITAISQEQAAKDYMSQTEAWDAYRQQVAAAAGQQPLSTGQVDSAPVDNIAASPSGELTLSAPEGEDLSAASTPSQDSTNQEVASLRDELQSVTQQVNAERGKNSALNNRLKELEVELESMQRSLSVRNDELAALQQQISKSAEVNQESTKAEKIPEPVPEEAAPDVAPTPQLEDEVAPPVEQMEEPAPVPTPIESEAATPEPQEPAPEPQVPETDDVTQPQVPTNFVDTILGTISGILMPILGSGLLLFIGLPVLAIVVILIVIMMFRKRSSAKDNFQESILSGAAPMDSEPAMSTDSQNSSETSSFLSDFAISGVGAIQTEDSEVDPLTEADVFMAYGRYEAAEERLQEAIQADPDRKELKVKLLEVYNTNKNQTAFESTAEDLYASLGDAAASDRDWQKVVVMGKQIAPNNPIFSASPTISSETTESVLGEMEENLSNASMTNSQVMDIGLETGVFNVDELSQEGPKEETDTGNLDFNLDENETDMGSLDFNLDNDVPVSNQEETHDNIQAPDEPDFNLGDEADTASDKDDLALDFNMDFEENDESTKSMAIDLNAMDKSESEMSDDEPTASMVLDRDTLDLDSTSAQLDTGSLDFDLDNDSDEGLDLNLDAADAMDMSLSADSDEVGTKLDLAKAYIDMGDSAGAKSILDEVLDEGSDSQKQEAEQLIAQLS